METTINTLDTTQFIRPNDETATITEDALYEKMSEEDFLQAVNTQLSRARSYWGKLNIEKRQTINFKYWIGEQVKGDELRDDLEKWVENVIFRNVETMIPIVTARVPEPSVTPAFKNDRTRNYAQTVKRCLMVQWEVKQLMQAIVAQMVRNHQMDLLAAVHFGYDPDEKCSYVELVKVTDLVISQNGDFVARYIKDKTLGDLLDMFPEKKNEILQEWGLSSNVELTKKVRSSPVEYLQVERDDIVGWKLNNLVLGVEKNPHFDYEGQEYQVQTGTDPMTGQPTIETKKVFFNYFKKPKMSYLFLHYYNRGVHIYDDTTLLEQGIGLQDWINKRKRQIGMNADSTNGHWVASGDFISEEEFMKVTGGIDEKIWLQNGKPIDGIMKVTGVALPDYIYNDLVDSRNSLNTLMGIEAATLGAQSDNKTLGQDVMQREQNFSRLGGYIRDGIEGLALHWYEYMYHMMLVYQKDEEAIAIPEDDDFETDNIIFSRESIPLIQLKNGDLVPCPLVFKVRAGSTLPQDEVAEYQKVGQMKGMLAPIDLFKKLGESNPRELAKNALIQQMDPTYFFKDDPDVKNIMIQKQQQAMQQAMIQQKQSQQEHQNKLQLEDAKKQLPPGDGGNSADASVVQAENVSDKGVSNALRFLMQGGAGNGAQPVNAGQ